MVTTDKHILNIILNIILNNNKLFSYYFIFNIAYHAQKHILCFDIRYVYGNHDD